MRKNELHLENLLSASIINALDRHSVSYSVSEQDGRYIAELEFYSDKGSNQIVNIWFDYDEEDSQYADSTACRSFAKGLKDYYESWDVDEYVYMWLEAKCNRHDICPLNARELVEDAEQIDKFLKQLSTEISQLA